MVVNKMVDSKLVDSTVDGVHLVENDHPEIQEV